MIHFVVHDEGDGVGVVVVEGVKAGPGADRLDHGGGQGDRGQGARATSRSATSSRSRTTKPGDTVIKYGVDIGKVVAPIGWASTLHVHNIKTKRW